MMNSASQKDRSAKKDFAASGRTDRTRVRAVSLLLASTILMGLVVAVAMLCGGLIVRFDGAHAALAMTIFGATYATYRVCCQRFEMAAQRAAALEELYLATLESLAAAIDAKDQMTHHHVRRVQIYAAGTGRALGLRDDEIEALRAGALLHDIGKLAVPDHILNKPGDLTVAEFEKMKAHTIIGAQLLESISFPYPVVPVIRHHHERWNGTGHPDGLRGEQIPITARILAVVDCFDALREDRPYRPGKSRREACDFLRQYSGIYFDPRVVEVFLAHLPRFEAEIEARGLGIGTRNEHTLPALVEIRRAHREVYALYEIASSFGSSLRVEDTAAIIADKVGHIVPFDTCAIYVYDETCNYARVLHAVGRNAAAIAGRCVAPGEGIIGFVLANRIAVSELDPMIDFAGLELESDEAYRSVLVLPLCKEERLLGALAIYAMEPNRYTEDHRRLLDTVARLASDALANALHHAAAESHALTDALTGLPNTRALQMRFEEEAARTRRTGRPFQLIMLDLDDFKKVNDTFGHKVGDQLLREIARRLQTQLRDYDFLARYAGDEFVALVHDLTAEQVDDLRQRIERTIFDFSLHVRGNEHARVGVSIGAASFGLDGETLDELLVAADQEMYTAKFARKRMRARLGNKGGAGEGNSLASSAVN